MNFSRIGLVAVAIVLGGCLALAVPQGAVVDDLVGSDRSAGGDRLAEDIPVSKPETFERLTDVLGVEGERPDTEVGEMNADERFEPSPFHRTMGLSFEPNETQDVTGLSYNEQVYIDPGNASTETVEQVLVHEYVHELQSQHDLAPWAERDSAARPTGTTDAVMAHRAVLEGGASWVTDRYVDEHLPNATRTSIRRSENFREESPSTALVVGPYHFGHEYVASQLDDPRNHERVYERPPNTTEQVIHNLSRDDEPTPPLSLDVDPGPYEVVDTDVQGELTTRVVLRAEVARDVAREAAAGWGADRLTGIRLGDGDTVMGYAWAHRWDSPEDATEFADAMDAFVANRSADEPADVRVERVSPETTVVLAGPPTFVERASASGADAAVSVTVRSPE